MFRMKYLSAALFAALAMPLVCFADQPTTAPAGKEQPVKPVEVTSASYKQEVLDSKVPVLMDFYAPWCGPCQQTSPNVDQAADLYKGKAKVCKVNTDNEPGLAAAFGANRIPTIVIVSDGKIVYKVTGYHSVADLQKALDDAIKNAQPAKKP
jgi:thioredoxin 1